MHRQWAKLQEGKEQGTAEVYRYKHGNNRIIYPFIKRVAGKIQGEVYYDLTTPRGQSGPWIDQLNTDNQSHLIKEFEKAFADYCRQENIIAEYIHFSPWKKHTELFSEIYDKEFYGHLYCNDLTHDIFKKEYSSTKRRNIRKAQKNNIDIVFNQSAVSIDNFLNLYANVEQKHDLTDYYKVDRYFLEKYIDLLKNESVFAQAIYKGKTISSALILFGEDIAHYHFSANHPKYNSLQATSLLIYESALYAKRLDKKIFDLGGAKPGSGLERFKQEFVTPEKKYPYYEGTKIHNRKVYNALVEKVAPLETSFFPAYRTMR